MKKRLGFVTNSSSSSFIMMKIQSKELSDVLKEFADELGDECGIRVLNFYDIDNEIEIFEDEAYMELAIDFKTPGDIIDCVAGYFDYDFYENNYRFAGDGKPMEDYESEEDFLELEEFSEMTQRLMEKRQELADSIVKAEITSGGSGWQGDDDSRYYREWYDEESLEMILENIAEQNGCEPDEVDDDMFCDYVGDQISEYEETVSYDKETGEFNYSSHKGLLD